jgi:hypothetical protein
MDRRNEHNGSIDMGQNILFICGSLNQTTMMHKIAQHLDTYNCFYSPYYADGWLGRASRKGLLDFTILGGKHRQNTEKYLAREKLPVDFGGRSRSYDLVVTCTDVLVQENIRNSRLVLVQEGMTVPEGLSYRLVRTFGLPRFLANTAATGLSDAYDMFCVASEGYRDLFIRKGVKPEKIVVTGIPNFDHAASYLRNDFPHRDYILATTSSAREAFMWTDRIGFIHKVKRVACGRKTIFKLHPNENFEQSKREIRSIIPQALIFTDGNVHQMIANCAELVTEFSSVVYTGLALGKTIHADFDLETVRHLTPIQNGGTSAQHIATICERLLKKPVSQALTPVWSFARRFKPFFRPSSQ